MSKNGKGAFSFLKQAWQLALLTFSAAALGACLADTNAGGGGGGISGTGVQTVATGTVTGFGSVIVGGIHYSAQPGASVQLEGNAATEADLQPGMQVVLHGTFDSASNTGSYDSIRYRADLEGPATAIDPITGTFSLFGQTVLLDAATVFDGLADLGALPSGALVQVSGSSDSLGRLHATRLLLVKSAVGPTDRVKVKGRPSNAAAASFFIGSQQIAFIPGQTIFNNLTIADLSSSDSRLIEVTGTLSGATLNATRVERLESTAGAVAGDRVYLSGFVLSGNAASFQLNTANGPITVAGGAASFTKGTPAAIQAGRKVEATGTLSGGVLLASTIEVDQETTIKIEGDLGSLDRAGRTVTLNGVTVVITDATLFKDSSAAQLRNLSLNDLAAGAAGVTGDHLQIGASLEAGVAEPRIIATRLERFNPSGATFIQGPVHQLPPQLVILGVPITLSAQTRYLKAGSDLGSLSAFTDQLIVDSTIVKARGNFAPSPAQLSASELEIQ
jgi:hypothetical protein